MKIEQPMMTMDETGFTEYSAIGTKRLAIPSWVTICKALYYQYENTSEEEWFKSYLMEIHEEIIRGLPEEEVEFIRKWEGHYEKLFYNEECSDCIHLRTNAQRLYRIVSNSIHDEMSDSYIEGQLEILEDFIYSDTYKDSQRERKFKIYLYWENNKIKIEASGKWGEHAIKYFDPLNNNEPRSVLAECWEFERELNMAIIEAIHKGLKKKKGENNGK